MRVIEHRRNDLSVERAGEKRNATPSHEVRAEAGGTGLIEKIADEWRTLCENSLCDEPFFRPEWIAAYVRFFVSPGELLLVTARSGGRLTAVLPLVKEHLIFSGIPVRRLRGATVQSIWRYDLVRARDLEGDGAVEAIWQFLRNLPGWDVLEFPDVAQGANLERLIACAEADGFPTGTAAPMRTPYVSLFGCDASDESCLKGTSPRFLSQLRRSRRKLQNLGSLELRRYVNADRVLLDRFYEIEHSGWKGRAGSAIASGETIRRFHDELARVAERYGYFTLYFLEHNGKAIAGDFGLTYRGCFYGPKSGYDETFRTYSPGNLLVQAELCDCAVRGLKRYDFLGHDEEWKQRWTSEFRPHSYWFVFRDNWHGRLARFSKFHVSPYMKVLLRRRNSSLK